MCTSGTNIVPKESPSPLRRIQRRVESHTDSFVHDFWIEYLSLQNFPGYLVVHKAVHGIILQSLSYMGTPCSATFKSSEPLISAARA